MTTVLTVDDDDLFDVQLILTRFVMTIGLMTNPCNHWVGARQSVYSTAAAGCAVL